MNGTRSARSADALAKAHPSISRWVHGHGWIEIGQDVPGKASIRAMDVGGLIWEGDASYPSLDAAFGAWEAALAAWLRAVLGR